MKVISSLVKHESDLSIKDLKANELLLQAQFGML